MRKCPYCGMLSDSQERCAWCRREFDVYFHPLAQPRQAPAKKQPWKHATLARGVVLVTATVLAIFSLAHVKMGPDAARIADSASQTSGTSIVQSPRTSSPNVGTYTPSFQQRTTAGSTGVLAPAGGVYAPSSANATSAVRGPAGGPAIAKLAAVHINTENDGNGFETAVGTVTIVNESAYQISSFDLTLSVNNSPIQLVPFDGNVTFPMAIQSKQIPPHGQLNIAVMTPSRYEAGELGSRSVRLTAHFDGTAEAGSDSATLR